jgi:4-hydroxy-4-methyl-2-oxoglutarate aldolase
MPPETPRIFGTPGCRIRIDPPRPDPRAVAALAGLASSLVGDGLGRRRIMDAGIAPLDRSRSACGPALTVSVRPGDNLMIHAAILLARPGDVLVIDAGGNRDFGIWGQIVTRAAMARGIAGVVLDGALRDAAGIVADGFPAWCRGVTPRGGAHDGPGEVNFPVACGGLAVSPGDVVLADGDGVCVVPADELAAARAGAEAKRAAEEARMTAIAAGDVTPGWLRDALVARGVWDPALPFPPDPDQEPT